METKSIAMELLKVVQFMYQNQEIDIETKNRIVQNIKNGMKNQNFSPVKNTLKVYSIGSNFKQEIDGLIQLL